MKYLIIISLLIISGCTDGRLTLTPEDAAIVEANVKKKGEARYLLFVNCMELAAKMPRQADDDVSEIVEECSSQAYYMTRYSK